MSEIPPIHAQPPISRIRKVERDKRQDQSQQQKQHPKAKPSEDDDEDQPQQHIDEIV